MTPAEVLKQYWGYDSFRECQAEIIDSVLKGKDTIGLMPTGGGKSVTFQVPALIFPGLTLVVTPLISLMKDQVDNLRRHDILAGCLNSSMTRHETRVTLDRLELGKIKLLYVSPEKLCRPEFIALLTTYNISLIVVDEAHCISQWGYDFRPSYLKISELRKHLPDVPVLALTATATPAVVTDIADKLLMKQPVIFRRSFSRDNISYIVRRCEVKEEMLAHILRNTAGSAIVYVRSRRRTALIAGMLANQGIQSQFYHAGLAPEDKTARQDEWMEGRVRVMVATNAFGMGIDL
ncbi:MAG: RecQ family ATP-dependent DNA helicase, partial [Muribaculaceae bacterium]|nr:RecQ family ATP-dependent DNA helicase [Muribaculaceae bacterium]